MFFDRWGDLRWPGYLLGGLVLGVGVGTCVHYLPDYGQCVKGHSEPRHQDAYIEMRTVENCYGARETRCSTSIYPIFHPAEDWTVWVCDQYEFPDGDGREQRKLRKER